MSVGQSKCKTKTADPCIRQLHFYNPEVHLKLTVGPADGGPWVLQSEDGEVAVVERTSRCFHQERSSVLLQMRVVYNFSKLKKSSCVLYFVYGGTHVPRCACGDQRTTCRSQFSSPLCGF